MLRSAIERLSVETATLRSQNQELLRENRALAEHIEREMKESRDEHDALLLRLEDSVNVSCALRQQLAMAQEQIAALKQVSDPAANQRLIQENQTLVQRAQRLEEENSQLLRSLASNAAVIQGLLKQSTGAVSC
jgi:Mg2+ and Co2+ transporter CorA